MDKREFTKLFLTDAGIAVTESSLNLYHKTLWASPMSPIGLRLSSEGIDFLDRTLKIQKYTCEIKKDCPRTLKIMLQMNKYLTSPFYIKGNKLVIYGEVDASMMALMSGDLELYLKNFER